MALAKADTASKHFAGSDYPAITLSISKKKGADAMHLAEKIIHKAEHLKKQIIPNDVQLMRYS